MSSNDHDHDHVFDNGRSTRDIDGWVIGMTTMLQSEAEQTAQWICESFPQVHAFAVDPHDFLTLGLDYITATKIMDAMAATGDPWFRNLIEEFGEWLRFATKPT
jgi:hypothetical protein